MALPVLPNASNFLGVALVINRNRDGPRFVFHYPPHIVPVESRQTPADDDNADDDDDDFLRARPAGPANGSTPYNVNVADLISWNQDNHIITDSGTQIVPWEHVAGYPTKDLEMILTPGRAYHKSLFQISLDPLYFVSYPIHKPENGIWKKNSKKKQDDKQRHGSGEVLKQDDGRASPPEDGQDGEPQHDDREASPAVDAREKAATEKTVPAKQSVPGQDETEEKTEDKISNMTMFNLVFILNPSKHEAKDLIETMYSNIIRKVNKAYNYVQQRSDFVWKESKKILQLKDKAREDKRKMSLLWDEILQTSSLAASMQDLYDAVSRNKIAALQLDTSEGSITHSVQVPIQFHITDLPPQDRQEDSRGLWITTVNSFAGDDTVEEPHYLDKNFALLLKDDDKKIIAELSADPDETTISMIEFVRHSKPTISFHQVAQQTNNILTLGQVRKYAQHFILWRRAIAVPPLHARDVYILSPNADMKTLPRASAAWARQFPFAPGLPNFLQELCQAPRPYKWFCPSKSFRPNYLVMLAWLLRGGWVTQLCTFAYVIVWPEILYEVEYALEAEEVAKLKKAQAAAADELEHGAPEKEAGALSKERKRRGSDMRGSESGMTSSIENLSASTSTLQRTASAAGGLDRSIGDLSTVSVSDRSGTGDTVTTDNRSQSQHPPSPPPPLSPPASLLRDAILASPDPQHSPSSTNDSLSASRPHSQPTLAEQVAEKARLERIAEKAAREHAEKTVAHARKAIPRATDHPSVNDAPHLRGLSPYIILDAKKATGKESLYLSAIQKRLREKRTPAPPASSKKVAAEGGGKKKDGKASGQQGQHQVDWDERVATVWPVFWKYFNGRSALERIALQEEMKRKDVWNLLTAMSEYLLTVRHW